MRLFSQIKSFWKFFVSSAAIIAALLICAILVASALVKDVYLTNLEEEMNMSSAVIEQELGDTIAGMRSQVAIIEKNEDLSVATLYAFDDLVKDGSYLKNELSELRRAIDITAIAMKSTDDNRVVYSTDETSAGVDHDVRTLMERPARELEGVWHRVDHSYFLMTGGTIVNVGETLARIYLIKEIGRGYLTDLAERLHATVLLQDNANAVVARSAGTLGVQAIACGPGLTSGSLIVQGIRYYYECTRIGGGSQAPTLVHLYDGSALWGAIGKTNAYLWIIGVILILVSVVLNLIVTKSFAAPVKALSRLMGVEDSDDLPLTFERIEDTTRRYQKDLAKKSYLEAVGVTSSMIAHDIRKPFTNMKSLLRVLPDHKDDPRFIEEATAQVDEAINKTESMLSDILEYSKKAEIEPAEVGVKRMMDTAIGETIKDAGRPPVEIECSWNHRHLVDVDEDKITRVFANIVDNALAAGCKALWIETDETDDGRWVEVMISNDGPKIEEEDPQRIFELFYSRGKRRGSGLGLAICRKFVKAHGGSIDVRSGEDRTVFAIRLPAGEGVECYDEVPEREDEVTVPSRVDLERVRRVLVVNDEEVMRVATRHELKRAESIDVLEASNVDDALDVMDQHKVDVILADIDLGEERDGFDLLREVKERGNGVRFYMMSGMSRDEQWPKAQAMGADGYIQLPYDDRELWQAVM